MLMVKNCGAKYWRYRFTFGGKEMKLALGVYPAVSLATAREKRDEARVTLRRGGR
ncbi:Arm DNA-binding domain-containing protein [Enterobacter cloacae]|uniref:Arm DNA-binding domain-containing protein n=1 Tax=Enterobacter cloacae TaxID=550 RepID=UPI003DA01E5F